MTTLDAIRDLCGSLPPFPDGCEVTGTNGTTVYAESPSGIKMMATLIRGKAPYWNVWRFPGICHSADALTCQRGASEPRGNVGG